MIEGFVFYIIVFIIGVSSGAFKRVPNQRKTKGKIVSLNQKIKTPNKRVTYTAVVAYTVGESTYYVETSCQSSFFRHGQRLTVCYNKLDPSNSFVRTSPSVFICIYLCILAGTALVISGFRSVLV